MLEAYRNLIISPQRNKCKISSEVMKTGIESFLGDEPIITNKGELKPIFSWYRNEPAPQPQAYQPPLTEEELQAIQSPLQHALYLLTKPSYKG
jgi:hypothetical protein